jgi:cold shock CspA family protein
MNKGQLKWWHDDKGFGFITSSTLEHDTFIHISALKHMSRKPKVGDTIYFEVATQPDGKTKAVNCRVECILAQTTPQKKPLKISKISRKNSPLAKLITLAIIFSISFSVYKSGFLYNQPTPEISNANIESIKPAHSNSLTIKPPNFRCDGRQHCRQMTSHAEALLFIKNCPDTKMDGDNDGDPCERGVGF